MYPTFSENRNQTRLLSAQEIETIYHASATRRDLFDTLLNDEPPYAHAETSKIRQESYAKQHHNQGCKCSKIGCLKLYCECFANGRQCSSACECSCCHNKAGNQKEIHQAKMMANYRHPGHFKGIPAWTPVRKCTCKKSMCRKKYCQCFCAGLECTELCECKDCHNGQPHNHGHHPWKENTMIEVSVHN